MRHPFCARGHRMTGSGRTHHFSMKHIGELSNISLGPEQFTNGTHHGDVPITLPSLTHVCKHSGDVRLGSSPIVSTCPSTCLNILSIAGIFLPSSVSATMQGTSFVCWSCRVALRISQVIWESWTQSLDSKLCFEYCRYTSSKLPRAPYHLHSSDCSTVAPTATASR